MAETVSLRAPEWAVLSEPDPQRNAGDFRLAPTEPPLGYRDADRPGGPGRALA